MISAAAGVPSIHLLLFSIHLLIFEFIVLPFISGCMAEICRHHERMVSPLRGTAGRFLIIE
jgi:hypothetical protein